MALSQGDIEAAEAAIKAVAAWANGGETSVATMPNGRLVPSPSKAIADGQMFKVPPIIWAPGLTIDDALQSYENGGVVYAPVPSALPFTTGGSFPAESFKYYVLQGVLLPQLEFLDFEWKRFGGVPTQTGATTFTVTGDQTAIFEVGVAVQLDDVSLLYGIVTSSAFAAVTTVTVKIKGGTALTGALTIAYTGSNPSVTSTSASAVGYLNSKVASVSIANSIVYQLENFLNDFAISVKLMGAVGDKTTDDTQAFTNAIAVAKASNGLKAVFVPSLYNGDYYVITSDILLNSSSLAISGDGIGSCIVQTAAGQRGLVIDGGALHCRVASLALVGTSGTSHGMQIDGASHYGKVFDLYIGYFSGDGLRLTSGQSWTFDTVEVDQNVAYVPITLDSGSLGSVQSGFRIEYNASGNTNNSMWNNCRLNAAGANGVPQLQIGDTTNPVGVTKFAWVNGLIQGTQSKQMIYAKCNEISITGLYSETIEDGVNFAVVFDCCRGVQFKNAFCIGSIQIAKSTTEPPRWNQIESITGVGGIDIHQDTQLSRFKDVLYRNSVAGPTAGSVINRSSDTIFERVNSLTGEHTHIPGRQGENLKPYYATNFDAWEGGGSPTVPQGFASGGGTITRTTTSVVSGTYSAETVITSTNVHGLFIGITPITSIRLRKVAVSVDVFVVTGTARIRGEFTGDPASPTFNEDSAQTGVWEKLYCTYYTTATDDTLRIRLTGDNGTTCRWGNFTCEIEDYDPIKELTVASAATIQVGSSGEQGYHIPLIKLTGSTSITAINGVHSGERLQLHNSDAGTIEVVDGTLISLDGGNNRTMAVDSSLFLEADDEGVLREINYIAY